MRKHRYYLAYLRVLCSIMCIAAATFLIYMDIDMGWGWLMFLAICMVPKVTFHEYKSTLRNKKRARK